MVLELLHPLCYFTNGCYFVYHLRSLNDFNCSYFVSIAFAVGIVNSYTCSLFVDGCADTMCSIVLELCSSFVQVVLDLC